jgi:hypothetical protein
MLLSHHNLSGNQNSELINPFLRPTPLHSTLLHSNIIALHEVHW